MKGNDALKAIDESAKATDKTRKEEEAREAKEEARKAKENKDYVDGGGLSIQEKRKITSAVNMMKLEI